MNSIILNEDGTANITITIVGEITQETYMGTFKVKCMLSPLELIKSDRLYRELLGANSSMANITARNSAFALSQLENRIIECPPFWENREIGGGHIVDANILGEVIELAIEAESRYRTKKLEELKEKKKLLTKKIKKGKVKKEEDEK